MKYGMIIGLIIGFISYNLIAQEINTWIQTTFFTLEQYWGFGPEIQIMYLVIFLAIGLFIGYKYIPV